MKFKTRVKKLENEISSDLVVIHFENGEIMKLTSREFVNLITKVQDQKVFPGKPIRSNESGNLADLIYSMQKAFEERREKKKEEEIKEGD